DLAEALAGLGRFPFRIAGFQATEPGAQDFIVRLSPADPADPGPILETVAAARPLLHAAGSWRPAPVPPEAAAAPPPQAAPEPMLELERLLAELDQAQAALHAMRSSTSWRITAPLRALKIRLT